MSSNKLSAPELIFLVTGFIGLLAIQLIFNRSPFYDEGDYLGNVALLHQYGLSNNFLVHLQGSAGPLYAVIHFLFEPLTRLQAPFVRWVNVLFLLGIIYSTWRTLALFNQRPPLFALYIMAVPMTYVITGMALTEIPAMFFFSLALYLLVKHTLVPGSTALVPLMAAGLCMGIAICGRQPFLLTLAALPVLFITTKNVQQSLLRLTIVLIFSLALPCYIFYVWQGLVPTIESQLYKDIAAAGGAYRPDFFLLCIFYFAAAMLLLAPGFYRIPFNRKIGIAVGLVFIIFTTANFAFQWIVLFPLKGLFGKVFASAGSARLFSTLCGAMVVFSNLFFTACLFYHLRKRQYPPAAVFFAAVVLLIACSCVKITWGFSSRYAAQGIPALVLLGSFFYRPSRYNMLRIGIGMLTGLLSVISYFNS